MEPPPDFRIGDRVKLISPLLSIAAGTIGTVVNRFGSGLLYDVQFDGLPIAHVVDGRKLTLVLREPSQRQ